MTMTDDVEVYAVGCTVTPDLRAAVLGVALPAYLAQVRRNTRTQGFDAVANVADGASGSMSAANTRHEVAWEIAETAQRLGIDAAPDSEHGYDVLRDAALIACSVCAHELADRDDALPLTRRDMLAVLRYLADPPEGVDHGAWIVQRIADADTLADLGA